ncbi:MAG: DUF6484 domain-containing protein [Candidatus Manganitrophaceae bacterium]
MLNEKGLQGREAISAEEDVRSLFPRIGRLSGMRTEGEVWVEWDGVSPRPARFLKGVSDVDLVSPESIGREVLLLFAEGDPWQPVIIGMIGLMGEPASTSFSNVAEHLLLEAKRITIRAEDSVEIECGEGRQLFRNDGKVVVRGNDLLQRATGSVRIKSPKVDIN